MAKKIVVILKGYPRLSETFIAQELLGLERSGLDLILVSMRHPTDDRRHPVHDEIKAPVSYLPEYLHDEALRVVRSWWQVRRWPSYGKARRAFLTDLAKDQTRNRVRRFGQALVLAAEFPPDGDWVHAHFIHTPASVAHYASLLMGLRWTCSAHAKDIWTSPDWELEGKLQKAEWVVTCTKAGFDKLRALSPDEGKVHLSYHGLDLSRFGPFEKKRAPIDGSDPSAPVALLSVGRAVEKKGYDILLDALALLPKSLCWRFIHVGGGELLPVLKAQARKLDLSGRLEWLGALPQAQVLAHYRKANLFVLPCRIAKDGDRDGLPNVLVEAASQKLPSISTPISGVPEFLTDSVSGLLVEPDNPRALADALIKAIGNPALRARLGAAAEKRVRSSFDHERSVAQLTNLFRLSRDGT